MSAREWRDRLIALIRRRELDGDLDDEIAAHLELATAENIERGMRPDEARRAAAARFGSIASAKDEVRDHRGLPGVSSLLQDVRYALRGMGNNPGFAIVAALTLSLGIGLCSMLFSILNGVLLKPLPNVPEPDRLVTVRGSVTYPYFESYRDLPDVASAAAAFIGPVPFGVALEGPGVQRPERTFGHLVSPEYFSALGVEPMMGRFFDPALELPGGPPVVVVSERFWRTRLQADPQVLGGSLRINGRRASIIGVGPKDFLGVFPVTPAEIFVPVTLDPAVAPELSGDVLRRAEEPAFRVVMRLAPGITMAAAESALDTQTRRLDEQAGKNDAVRDKERRLVRLMSAGSIMPVVNEQRAAVLATYVLLMALILALTCASLAGLILARGGARAKEIAIRLSLGAGRFRLVRQLLTESFLLAALGGAAGLALAHGLIALQTQAAAGSTAIPTEIPLTPDLRVVLLTFLAATLASVGCGLIPALATTRPDLVTALKGASTRTLSRYRRFGLRNLFVVCQVAAAMALVLIMGFVILGMNRNLSRDPGFDSAGVYVFKVDPARDGFSPEESAVILTGLPEQLARVDAVEGVTLSNQPPLGVMSSTARISVPASASGEEDATHSISIQRVAPRFFATLGVSLLRGKEFDERELRSDPTPDTVLPAVLNHTAARQLFGDADPLGRRIRQEEHSFEVIGVARYGVPPPFQSEPSAALFLPLSQPNFRRGPAQGTSVIVRSRTALDIAAMRHELEAMDSRLTMFDARKLDDSLDEFDRALQYSAAIHMGIGIFALLLACVGLAGVTAQAVECRRKEIGIRMAIGARAPQVLRLVMSEGAAMVVVGSVLGFAAAYGIARLLSSMTAELAHLIGRGAGDPVLTLGVPLLLISLVIVACYLPARRSTSIDPLVALREE